MGEVYKAEDTKLKRLVALKFLPPHLTRDKEANERFLYEAQTASALDHQNICTIHEIAETEEDGRLFICMACYEGETLKSIIDGRGLTIEEAVDIAIQVAQGLARAHAKGIIHRDIKPGNLIVQPNGVVKIIDFGLSKLIGARDITRSKTTQGTVAYMSPEQIKGKTIDSRVDIWALGVVLYEMLTGERPFKGEVEQTVIYSILNEAPEPILSLCSDLPNELTWIINRALVKNPRERYADMQEMIADFDTIRKHDKRSITPRRSTKPKKARRLLIYAAAFIAIVVGIWASMLYFSTKENRNLNPRRVAVAVFENRTGDAALDQLGKMAADWITQGLAQTGVVETVPSTSVLRTVQYLKSHADSTLDVVPGRALAEQTGAGIMVCGSYYKHGETLQLQAQIIDMQDDKLLGAVEPVSGSWQTPMAAIERLRQGVMGTLATYYDPMLSSIADKMSPPPTFEAYQAYIAGREHMMRSKSREALRYFEKAARMDSLFPQALCLAAFKHLDLGHYAQVDSIVAILVQNYERLAPLDRLITDRLRAEMQGDRAETLRIMRRLAEIAPDPGNYYTVGRNAVLFNRPKECIEVFKKMDPEHGYFRERAAFWEVVTAAYHMLGDYKGELKAARRGRRLHPTLRRMMAYEARALVGLGRVEEARKLLDEAQTLPDQPGWPQLRFTWGQGVELRKHGYPEASMEVLGRALVWLQNRSPETSASRSHRADLAEVLYYTEHWQAAHQLFKELVYEDSPHADEARWAGEYTGNVVYLGYLGTSAARLGQTDQARQIARELQKMQRPYLFGLNTFWSGCIYGLLGEREQAVTLLREAFAQGYWYSTYPLSNIDLEPLRDYPPFQELMRPEG